MKKKNIFTVLENIEQNKLKKDMINIANLCLQKKQHLKKLEILVNYQKEYFETMHKEMISGMSLHIWNNYKNFISMLDKIIKENLCFISNHDQIIQDRLKSVSKIQIKLKTWINFNIKHKKYIYRIKNIKEQKINDNHAQLKFFNHKDNYLNVRNN